MNMMIDGNTAALSAFYDAEEAAEVRYYANADEREEKRDHIKYLAICLLSGQPTNIRRNDSVFSYTLDDFLGDYVAHKEYMSVREARKNGNPLPRKRLIMRLAQRGIALSTLGEVDAENLGFFK